VTSLVLADAEIICPNDTVNIVVTFLISPLWKESSDTQETIMLLMLTLNSGLVIF
jgi:hypothetical protein